MITLSERELRGRACQLKLLVLDVDGVLTEGELTYIGEGLEARRFYAHDGIGIMMAREAGIKVAFITGKDTPMVSRRAEELRVDELLQGFFSKEDGLRHLLKKLGLAPEQVAYAGDDIHDIPALKIVGMPLGVANARPEVKEHSVYVTEASGGHGAVRELVEWLLTLRGEKETVERQFSQTSEEKEKAEHESKAHLVVYFGPRDSLLDLLNTLPADATLILGDPELAAKYHLRRVQSLSDYQNPHFGAEANQLLTKLNTLMDSRGQRYSARVQIEGYEPWWFQQDQALGHLQAYNRYRPLLERLSQAATVTIYHPPQELETAIRLYPLPNTEVRYVGLGLPFGSRFVMRVMAEALQVFRRTVSTLSFAWALVRRPQAFVFSSDVVSPGKRYDARIEKVYSALSAAGVRYLEVFGSRGQNRTIPNLLERRRPCLYRDVAPTWLQWGHLRRWSSQERISPRAGAQPPEHEYLHALAERVLIPASARSVQMVRNLSWIVRWVKPRFGVFLDDSRYAHELVVACRMNGVPTLGVQHGLYCCIAPGFIASGFEGARNHGFDRYFLWSPFFVDYLNRVSSLFSRENLRVGGLPKERASQSDGLALTPTSTQSQVKVMFVVEAYDAALQNSEVFAYLRALMSDPRIALFVKLRPGQETAPFVGIFGPPFSQATILKGPIDPYFAEMDVVVGSWGTAVVDVIYHRRPLVLFTTSQYDDPLGLTDLGIAAKAREPKEIVAAVLAAAQTSTDALARYKELVWGTQDVDVSEVVIQEILGPTAVGR